jgi:hypothetical protein
MADATTVPMRLESRRALPTSGMTLFAQALIDVTLFAQALIDH